MRTKLRLVKSEIETLNNMLQLIFASYQMDSIKEQPNDYVIMSALYEVYEKVNAKYKSITLFPVRPDKIISLTLTRTQALALDVVINPHEDTENVGTYGWDLARRICETIYNNYYA